MAPWELQLRPHSFIFFQFFMLNHKAMLNLLSKKLAQFLPQSSGLYHFIAFVELEYNMWLGDLFFPSIVFLNNKKHCIIKPHLWVFSWFMFFKSCLFAATFGSLRMPFSTSCFWKTLELNIALNLFGFSVCGLVWFTVDDLESLLQLKWFYNCGRFGWA